MTPGELRRARLVMSWSTTTRAVLNGLGYLAIYPTHAAQDQAQGDLQARLDAAEAGDPFPQDRWVLDRDSPTAPTGEEVARDR